MAVGVAVPVAVAVAVGLPVGVAVAVAVGLPVGVAVAVGVALGEGVALPVGATRLGVAAGVPATGVGLAVVVGVEPDAVLVAGGVEVTGGSEVEVWSGVGVAVGVGVGDRAGVLEAVGVGVAVALGEGSAWLAAMPGAKERAPKATASAKLSASALHLRPEDVATFTAPATMRTTRLWSFAVRSRAIRRHHDRAATRKSGPNSVKVPLTAPP